MRPIRRHSILEGELVNEDIDPKGGGDVMGHTFSSATFLSSLHPYLAYYTSTAAYIRNLQIPSISYSRLVLFSIPSLYSLATTPPVPQLQYFLLLVNRWVSSLYPIRYTSNILSSAGEQPVACLSRLVPRASRLSLSRP